MSTIFSPSLMCMDMAHVADEISIINKHCTMLHADIMDGHFAPNLSLCPSFVKTIRSLSNLPIDAHMMVTNPDMYIESLKEAGATFMSVHAEAIGTHAFRTIRAIKQSGMKLGVALCPASPLADIESYIDEIDMLTIMTVDVGYAGQSFIPQMLCKIHDAALLRNKNKLNFLIQVDGAVGPRTYKRLHEAGADVYVMGTSGLFKKELPLDKACLKMKEEFASSVI